MSAASTTSSACCEAENVALSTLSATISPGGGGASAARTTPASTRPVATSNAKTVAGRGLRLVPGSGRTAYGEMAVL
jgi:hypothetical protein